MADAGWGWEGRGRRGSVALRPLENRQGSLSSSWSHERSWLNINNRSYVSLREVLVRRRDQRPGGGRESRVREDAHNFVEADAPVLGRERVG